MPTGRNAEVSTDEVGNRCAAGRLAEGGALFESLHSLLTRPGHEPGRRPSAASDRSEDTMNAPLPEAVRKALESVSLDDKYALESGRAFMSGVQALVRLPMLQKKRDAMFGLNTAGFVSGYRGSPLGGYDQALVQAKKHLAAQSIVFQPGVNEELAATAVWGTQQLALYPQSAKFDGVFGIWYGKGPGVDRCSDVFKHPNIAGH